MKKVLLTLLTATLAFGASAQKIKGSDTVLPLSQKWSETYMKAGQGSGLVVTGGGSGVGIASLIDGSTDIAMASRRIKFDEKMKIQNAGQAVVEKIISWDALAVVVNPKNSVSKLTREQLEGIFTGKITNWNQVGGADMKIVCYSRESSSGTYEFFKESILKNKNYMSAILSMPATGAIMQSVAQTPGAIGYVGVAYLNNSVKPLEVSYDGKTYVKPSYATAKDKSYPVVRPLYFYYLKKDEAKIKKFMDYAMGADGQKISKELGYIDVL